MGHTIQSLVEYAHLVLEWGMCPMLMPLRAYPVRQGIPARMMGALFAPLVHRALQTQMALLAYRVAQAIFRIAPLAPSVLEDRMAHPLAKSRAYPVPKALFRPNKDKLRVISVRMIPFRLIQVPFSARNGKQNATRVSMWWCTLPFRSRTMSAICADPVLQTVLLFF